MIKRNFSNMKKPLIFIFVSLFLFHTIACNELTDGFNQHDTGNFPDIESPIIAINQRASVSSDLSIGSKVLTVVASDNVGITSFEIMSENGVSPRTFTVDTNGNIYTATNLNNDFTYTLLIRVEDYAGNSNQQDVIINTFFDCLVAGTKVLTPHGERVIETLMVGDLVFSYNHSLRKIITNSIEAIKKSAVNKVFRFTLENGRTVECTPEHPFYMPIIGDYVTSKNLKVGDSLLDNKRKIKKIVKINFFSYRSKVDVYDITVGPPNHNFFAGGVLVHNKTPVNFVTLNLEVLESTTVGSSVGYASGSSAGITNFSIISGNANNAFAISNNGNIYLTKTLDYSEVSNYNLQVESFYGSNVYVQMIIINITHL